MGGNTGEIEIGSERGLYKKYINHQAGTFKQKVSTRMILVQIMYNTFRLILIVVPDDRSE